MALQKLDVTLAIDRAGFVGGDGATHAGIFDVAFLRCAEYDYYESFQRG